jgi:hypothetical protein
MNLDTAISAHAAWKTKFRTAITAKEPMDAATIGKDNCCELGNGCTVLVMGLTVQSQTSRH